MRNIKLKDFVEERNGDLVVVDVSPAPWGNEGQGWGVLDYLGFFNLTLSYDETSIKLTQSIIAEIIEWYKYIIDRLPIEPLFGDGLRIDNDTYIKINDHIEAVMSYEQGSDCWVDMTYIDTRTGNEISICFDGCVDIIKDLLLHSQIDRILSQMIQVLDKEIKRTKNGNLMCILISNVPVAISQAGVGYRPLDIDTAMVEIYDEKYIKDGNEGDRGRLMIPYHFEWIPRAVK